LVSVKYIGGATAVQQPKWVALFEWREQEFFECVAAFAAAAALAKLADGLVFDSAGTRGELAESAFQRARDLFAQLLAEEKSAKPGGAPTRCIDQAGS
jgi:hypothetical protein